jgi:SPW repeat
MGRWEAAMIPWRRETPLDIYNLVLGATLLASPWLFSYAREAARADDWASGATVIALSAAAVLAFAQWEEWTSLMVGLWIAASPWVLGFQHGKAMPINIAIGLLIAYMSALELWLIHYNPAPQFNRDDRRGPAVT